MTRPQTTRKTARVLLIVFGGAVFLVLGGAGWLVFYSRDLPDTTHLNDFAPATQRQVTADCLDGPVIALPYDQIGKNLRDAVSSVERTAGHRTAGLSVQVARTLFCNSHDKMLTRHLKELRVAIQLDRHFSKQELFTIYLNRVYLGDCGDGVESTAQCLFHKDASNLTAAEAALIAGMIRSPSRFSPYRHPERALARRNEVLNAMVAAKTLSLVEAASAKAMPLSISYSK
jgi:membrane carboxypeptidase/penicillin-binding protein